MLSLHYIFGKIKKKRKNFKNKEKKRLTKKEKALVLQFLDGNE
jgi:hypothetical protein